MKQENIQTSAAQTVKGSSTPHIPGPVTADEKIQKKNDLKARSMHLMALPNEHLITFNQYKDAKSLFDEITIRFGGNDATRKTQKTLLKQINNDDVSTVFGVNLKQIHEYDPEKMDLKCQLALLSMRAKRFFQKTGKKITINGSDTTGYDKAKVECFNYHKIGNFARECRVPRNQENRTKNQKTTRRTLNVEDTSSKAMVVINGASFYWSYMADDEAPTNMAFMTFSDSELEKISIDKDDIEVKIKKFENASHSLDKLIGSQITDKSKRGLGYVSYNVVPPPHTGRFLPLRIDLSHTGLPEFIEPVLKAMKLSPLKW
nr:hypothetical protein [Tanacetum cinerariifolium]